MNQYQLGQLKKVAVQDVWPKEAYDFTPWLSQQLPLLSEVLGIPLELLATEHPVGPFRADLLCQSGSDESRVVIENQFYKTDHSHLGQLLTYMAGTGAKTVVWIAETFTPEHRAALDWLNENTVLGVNFFGLELELWQIGDSLPAPKFNVVSQPNSWAKVNRASVTGDLSEIQQLRLSFWEGFREYVLANTKELRPLKPSVENWYEFYMGKNGVWIGARVNSQAKSLWVGFFMQPPVTKNVFYQLQAQKQQLDQQIGTALIWKEGVEGGKSNIEIHRQDSDIRDTTRWTEYFEWLLTQLLKLKNTFGPLLPELKNDWAAETAESPTSSGFADNI